MGSNTIRAIVLDLDGTTEVIDISQGGFQQAFREHCEAQWFDCLHLDPDLDIWVDDEGLFHEPVQVNEPLTQLRDQFWRDTGVNIPPGWPPLAGKALLTGGVDGEGRTLSLSPEMVEQLEGYFKTWREG